MCRLKKVDLDSTAVNSVKIFMTLKANTFQSMRAFKYMLVEFTKGKWSAIQPKKYYFASHIAPTSLDSNHLCLLSMLLGGTIPGDFGPEWVAYQK